MESSIWFAQAEAQFPLDNIVADDTKYDYVLSALDQATVSQLKDLSGTTPEDDKWSIEILACWNIQSQQVIQNRSPS